MHIFKRQPKVLLKKRNVAIISWISKFWMRAKSNNQNNSYEGKIWRGIVVLKLFNLLFGGIEVRKWTKCTISKTREKQRVWTGMSNTFKTSFKKICKEKMTKRNKIEYGEREVYNCRLRGAEKKVKKWVNSKIESYLL